MRILYLPSILKKKYFTILRFEPVTLSSKIVLSLKFKTIVKNLPYAEGGTNAALGLRSVIDEDFSLNNGERPWANQILIMVTDGNSGDRFETWRANQLIKNRDLNLINIILNILYIFYIFIL